MNIVIEKNNNNSVSKYLLIGATKNTSNFGLNECVTLIVCDNEGEIYTLNNTSNNLKVGEFNSRTPAGILPEYECRH